jgi:hypothetical protein
MFQVLLNCSLSTYSFKKPNFLHLCFLPKVVLLGISKIKMEEKERLASVHGKRRHGLKIRPETQEKTSTQD